MATIIPNNACIGNVIDYKGQTLRVSPSTEGCKKCAFESEEGANYCKHRTSCFADSRPDKISVKFLKVKK